MDIRVEPEPTVFVQLRLAVESLIFVTLLGVLAGSVVGLVLAGAVSALLGLVDGR